VEEVGDLFKYSVKNPVTVLSNQSALVPIVAEQASGIRVALFNEEKHSKFPNSSVLFSNTTGLTLEGGPVTILEESTFVGEAIIETIQPNETKFIEFSVEKSVEVWSTSSSEDDIYKCTIRHGSMKFNQHRIHSKKYNIRNKSDKIVTLYLEHRFRKDCKLVSKAKPTNPNPIHLYIFRVRARANATTKFVVKESGEETSSFSLSSIDQQTCQNWFTKNYIDKKTKTELNTYLSLSLEIADLKKSLNVAEQSVREIGSNQQRLRSNLSTIGNAANEQSLRQRYISELEKEEGTLANLRAEVKRHEAAIREAQSKQETILRTLSLVQDVKALSTA